MAPVASKASALPSGAAGASKRRVARDLLPLPPLPSEKISPSGRSRTSAQKVARHAAAVASANETVWALNSLYGEDRPLVSGLSLTQRSTHQSLYAAALSDAPPNSESSEAAFRRLLGSRAAAYTAGSLDNTAPFDQSRLSWPRSAGKCSLHECLPASEALNAINVETNLLLAPEEFKERVKREGTVKPHWDPALRNCSPEYLELLRDLLARDMVVLRTDGCRARAGLFCVSKKIGKLRLIVDARVCNQLFRKPPSTHLASTAAVVEFEVGPEESISFAAQDVADCYYQFRLPLDLQGYFGLQDVTAGQLGISTVNVEPVSPATILTPCFSVVPMGFSWALHWTQQAHRELLVRGGMGGAERELLDKAPVPDASVDPVPRILYEDNQVSLGRRPGLAESERQRAAKILDAAQLPYHDVVKETSVIECIGLELDGVYRLARLGASRRWTLRRSVAFLRRRPFASGQQLEILVGHFTHAMLRNRPALSCFRYVYAWIRRHYLIPTRLPKYVLNEFRAAAGFLNLLVVRWDLAWHPEVSCSDATLHGYAVHTSTWKVSSVSETGRWSDRWRFRWGAGDDPRARA